MRTIWKFTLGHGANEIAMPKESQILSAQVQDGRICLWVLVDPAKDKEFREFQFFGTGHPVPNECYDVSFIGTVQLEGGALIFHVFELV